MLKLFDNIGLIIRNNNLKKELKLHNIKTN